MTDLVLGLDSGGTKTIAVAANRAGEIVAHSGGDGLDPTYGDAWETRFANLLAPLPPVGCASLGLPFHGEVPAISARQQALAATLIGPQAVVVNDVAIAFEGALAGGDGVLILAGTGSMAWARGPLGTHRVGGWGDAFGDEGSAYWIGREALSLTSQHLDGRISSPDFAQGILAALGIPGDGLIGWAYSQPNPRMAIAAVAADVSDLAANGNADARQILTRAATWLATLGRTAATAAGAPPPLIWSFAGGVFRSASLLPEVTLQMPTHPILPILPPVGGAVLLAAKAAGWAADPAFVKALSASLQRL